MRLPYIFVLLLMFATVSGVSGCSLVEQIKKPNSLASRVGNFSPAKLDSDQAEIRAAKNVTPLIQGSRDLDGRQEQFDPAFGAPETQAELNQERSELNAARRVASISSVPTGAGNVTIAGSQMSSPVVTPTRSVGSVPSLPPAQTPQTAHTPPFVQTPDSSRFGRAHGSIKPTSFAPTRSTTPISDMPSTVTSGNQQGFGCPPAGMSSLGSSNSFGQPQAPTARPSYQSGVATAPQVSSLPTSQPAAVPSSASSSLPSPTSSSFPPPNLSSQEVSPRFVSGAPSDSSPRETWERSQPQGFSNPAGNLPNSIESASTQQAGTTRLDSSPPPSTSGWNIGGFRLPSFKFPFQPTSPSPASGRPTFTGNAGDLAIVEAQSNRARNVVVTITATVKKLLPDDTKGSPHQRFLLQLSNGTTVLVAHNISLAPYVPLREGDRVTICGEYIWNEKGGVLHYTHHTTNRKHQGGYIQYNNQTYQ